MGTRVLTALSSSLPLMESGPKQKKHQRRHGGGKSCIIYELKYGKYALFNKFNALRRVFLDRLRTLIYREGTQNF